MIELTPENVVDYLRSVGRLPRHPVHVEALGWGVSNAVLRVEGRDERFILKQSRPQLRTRDPWFSDLDRVYREQEVMEALEPLLPSGVVPRVLFSDRENYVFAMTHAPVEARVWKETLLAGEVERERGRLAGEILGRIHQASVDRRAAFERFGNRDVFVQLRVDPFYRRVQERCLDVKPAVAPLVERLMTAREGLCHGDFSPKNLLGHSGGFVLVDYETAHIGDPTMDLGFFLSHLMLKAVKRHAERKRYFDLTRAFWEGYEEQVRFRPVAELESAGIGHFGLCVLARVDGTSPVDYLTDDWQKDAARRLGRLALLDRPRNWEQVLGAAEHVLSSAGSTRS